MNKNEELLILGGGPVGSLLSIFFKRKGYEVDVFEKRKDIRNTTAQGGKSINIALSKRGWTALDAVDLKDKVMTIALPMYGRMVHKIDGSKDFQPYTLTGDAIYSVSRSEVNKILIEEAEKLGVNFHFDQNCKRVDLKTNTLYFRNENNELHSERTPGWCVAADGAYSALRSELIKFEGVNYSQEFLDYGYKELHLPADKSGHWQLEKEALHIWPRKDFMLIALPNRDGSFTCTLFLKHTGEESMQSLADEIKLAHFFDKYFPDVALLISDYKQQFLANPLGNLVTIKCFPWHKRAGDSMYSILGDAAHAITPFFGQGMNCGFEDARILSEMVDAKADLDVVLSRFEIQRKGSADAIAQMAYDNFIEMRNGVVDDYFLKVKKVEKELKKELPEWKSKYELVSFSNIAYSTILAKHEVEAELMNTVIEGKMSVNELAERIKENMGKHKWY